MKNEFKIDQLTVFIYENKFLSSQAAADMAEKYTNSAIEKKGAAVIILATGASQFEFLNSLTARHIDWNKVIAFHLDEYVGLPADHPASFRRYLRERIIDKVSIQTFCPIQGDSRDVETEINRLNELLSRHTVDAAFVGIGENGHLAFNDPPATFDDQVKYKMVDLDEACRRQQMGEGWFKTLDEVPKQAITMTIPAIMEAKTIICTVPDERKAKAVKNTMTKEISGRYPASILRQHPQAFLFLDWNSASLLERYI